MASVSAATTPSDSKRPVAYSRQRLITQMEDEIDKATKRFNERAQWNSMQWRLDVKRAVARVLESHLDEEAVGNMSVNVPSPDDLGNGGNSARGPDSKEFQFTNTTALSWHTIPAPAIPKPPVLTPPSMIRRALAETHVVDEAGAVCAEPDRAMSRTKVVPTETKQELPSNKINNSMVKTLHPSDTVAVTAVCSGDSKVSSSSIVQSVSAPPSIDPQLLEACEFFKSCNINPFRYDDPHHHIRTTKDRLRRWCESHTVSDGTKRATSSIKFVHGPSVSFSGTDVLSLVGHSSSRIRHLPKQNWWGANEDDCYKHCLADVVMADPGYFMIQMGGAFDVFLQLHLLGIKSRWTSATYCIVPWSSMDKLLGELQNWFKVVSNRTASAKTLEWRSDGVYVGGQPVFHWTDTDTCADGTSKKSWRKKLAAAFLIRVMDMRAILNKFAREQPSHLAKQLSIWNW